MQKKYVKVYSLLIIQLYTKNEIPRGLVFAVKKVHQLCFIYDTAASYTKENWFWEPKNFSKKI